MLTPHRLVARRRVPAPPGTVLGRGGGGSASTPRSTPAARLVRVLDVHLSPPRRRRARACARQRPSSPGPARRRAGADHRRRPQRRPGRTAPTPRSSAPGGSTPGRRSTALTTVGATNWTPGDRAGRPPTQRIDYVFAPPGCGRRGCCRDRRRRRADSTSSPACPTTCRSWPRCACRERARRDGDDRVLAKVRKLLAKAEATDNAQRGRGVLGQGGRADRRPPHRPVAARRRRPTATRLGLRRGADRPRRLRAGPAGPARRRRRGQRLRARLAVRARRGDGAARRLRRPTSTPRSCSTSRCTCRPPRRWPRCAGRRRRRRSAGGGRSCSASPPASASCSATPAATPRPTPGRDGHAAARPAGRGRRRCASYASTAFGRVVAAGAPSPAVAGGWDQRAARRRRRADIGRGRAGAGPAGSRRDRRDVDRPRRVYAAEDAAFGGTDLDDEPVARRARRAGRPASPAASGGGPVRGAAGRASSRHGRARATSSAPLVGGPAASSSASPRQRRRRRVAHELAHALAGVGRGHDATFRAAHVDVVALLAGTRRRRPPARRRTPTTACRRAGGRWPPPVRLQRAGFVVVHVTSARGRVPAMSTEDARLDLTLDVDGALVLSGEIDSYTAPDLADRLAGDPPVEVVDLSAVTFIDSSGLRTLVEAHRSRQRRRLRGSCCGHRARPCSGCWRSAASPVTSTSRADVGRRRLVVGRHLPVDGHGVAERRRAGSAARRAASARRSASVGGAVVQQPARASGRRRAPR